MRSNDLQHLYLGDILIYLPSLETGNIREYHITNITEYFYRCDTIFDGKIINWTAMPKDKLENYMLLKEAKQKMPQYFI